MSARGVIFDLDGTLAHTLPDIVAAVNFGLRSFNLPEQPEMQVRAWIGDGMPMLCQRALAGQPSVFLPDMVERVTGYYREHRMDQARPFEGIPELLDELTARGIPMAVLSNKPHEHAVPMVEALFERWQFVAVEGYREEARRKPDPRTALEIAERMGVPRDQVLMVGDSEPDILTAVNAGLVPVGVTWGYRPVEELAAAGARWLIDHPRELLERL